MEQWNVTIKAKDEKDALRLVKFLGEAFKLSVKVGEPLDHAYADLKGAIGNDMICERVKK